MSKERVRRGNDPEHYGKTVTINRNRETEGRGMIWREKTKLDLEVLSLLTYRRWRGVA